MPAGFRCAVCGTTVDVAKVAPWRCPRASAGDRHHVLRIVDASAAEVIDHPNPFVRYAPRMAWYAFARANGMTDDAALGLALELDAAVATVAGTGFVVTPCEPHPALAAAVSEVDFHLLVKDETDQVAGSHKARHLASILLHLRAAEALGLRPGPRPPLAIASCGNAALAAATLARAVDWPLRVFVPPWADGAVVERLGALGADLTTCPRVDGDPPGDPCIHRFREAVDAGAVPFSVQGPENALCLDGGRTIGWELAEQTAGRRVDRVFVQVGGGALAAGVADGWRALGAGAPALVAVQTEGCAPLARAWRRAEEIGVSEAPSRWAECMWPWGDEPHSLADGILDDETYDWVGVVEGMHATGGAPVVVPEAAVVEAQRLARERTSIPVSPTGSAGLAGLLTLAPTEGETVVVLFTGRAHTPPPGAVQR